jgi:hypothetical protein
LISNLIPERFLESHLLSTALYWQEKAEDFKVIGRKTPTAHRGSATDSTEFSPSGDGKVLKKVVKLRERK